MRHSVFGDAFALIYKCIPNGPPPSRYGRSDLHRYTATGLHAMAGRRSRMPSMPQRPFASRLHLGICETGSATWRGGVADEKHGPSIRIPADEFRNHKKEGHGHPHSRKPVPHLRHRDNRVESISTRFHIPVLALRIWEGADLSLYSTTVASVGMAPRTAAYSVG